MKYIQTDQLPFAKGLHSELQSDFRSGAESEHRHPGDQTLEAESRASSPVIVIIDESAFARDCLARCLREIERNCLIVTCASVEEWRHSPDRSPLAVVLLCAVGKKATETALRRDLVALKSQDTAELVVIVSDVEDPDQMLEALNQGARGYITSSLNLDVAVEAIHLVRAGGVFIPASGLLKSRAAAAADESAFGRAGSRGPFTARQAAVVEALRKGQPNKLIAYQLNMGECTVKVHVRNIMKKLKARNRTEVAFLTNHLFANAGDA